MLAFFTFARLSSLVPASSLNFDASRWPTIADVRFHGTWASLKLKYSKTRQQADGGRAVPFRAARTPPCPVTLAQQLCDRALAGGLTASTPLFAIPAQAGTGFLLLTQSKARRFLGACLKVLGLPTGAYTFHSFRRGGCSLAFARGGAESDLALHGDWCSAAIRDYYPAEPARFRVAGFLADNP